MMDKKKEYKVKEPGNLKMSHRFQSIMFMGVCNESELLIVERPVLEMLQNLPQSFYKKKYGT